MKYMSILMTSLVLLSVNASVSAALQEMGSEQLSEVNGGATTGLQLALDMKINQDAPGTLSTICQGTTASFCRVGLQFNGQTDWLLLKGFNGYINIPKIILYGATVAPQTGNQTAIAIKIDPTDLIQIKNLGYTLAQGKATGATSVGTDPYTGAAATQNQNIYLAAPVRYTSATSASAYDTGRETGILGININGNVKVGGTLFMFSK